LRTSKSAGETSPGGGSTLDEKPTRKPDGAMMPEMLRWLWQDYARPEGPVDDSNRKLLEPLNAEPAKIPDK